MSRGCKLPPLTLLSLSLSLSYSHTHTRTPTLLPPALLQIALHWWNFNGSFRKNNEHASPWSCVYVCVRGCFHTWQSYGGMQQTCICAHSMSVFLSLSCSLFYTHSPEYTPTHTQQSCTDSLTLPPFLHLHATCRNTHRHTDTKQAYTQQHQTLLLTDTHPTPPVTQE